MVDKRKTAELLLEQENQKVSNDVAAANKVSDTDRQNFDEERSKLYKQIDERVRNILK